MCGVVVAGTAATSILHGTREPEMEAASISLCVSLSIRELVANCSRSCELHSSDRTAPRTFSFFTFVGAHQCGALIVLR